MPQLVPTVGVPARRQADVREHNLALVLAEVHSRGRVSRAELTELTGLNRSTVGALVSDLQDLGLVGQHRPGNGPRSAGRPSHQVVAREDGPYSIAVQLDVDRLVVAVVGLGGTVLGRAARHLSPGASPAVVLDRARDALCRLERALPAGARACGVGVSVPGTVRRRDGVLRSAPNLGWREVPLASLVATRMIPHHPELVVRVGNDADLGVRAERLRGAARGVDDVVYLLGNTGIGGGIVCGGVPVTGARGYGGEIGHMVIALDGPACSCGGRGCLETLVGSNELCRLAGPAYLTGRDATARVIADAHAGVAVAAQAVRVVGARLGVGLAAIANMLDPEVIIVGGLLRDVRALAGTEVDCAMSAQLATDGCDRASLAEPDLGRDSSLLGAAELGFDQLLDWAQGSGWLAVRNG